MTQKETLDVDIVVVGAGFAGLAAADTIVQYNAIFSPSTPLTFVVLEGGDRAGGRTRTVTEAPLASKNGARTTKPVGYLDVGGQYLGRDQSYMKALIERFNISTFDTFMPANKTSVFQNKDLEQSQTTGDPVPQLTYFVGNYPLTFNVIRAIGVIESLTQIAKASLADPWETLSAKKLDETSVADWAKQQLKDDAYGQTLTQLAIRCAFSVEWTQISMLYLLFYGATAGSFEAFENVAGAEGGDRIRFATGTQSLIEAWVAFLTQNGTKEVVKLGHRVTRIEQRGGSAPVRVVAQRGDNSAVWVARSAIVAMSPGPSTRIEYKPELPEGRRALAGNMIMGQTTKGFLLYESPWWREKYTGYVLSAKGPACWFMDNTWQDPATGNLGQASLMAFVAGGDAGPDGPFAQSTADGRRDALAAQAAEIFSDPRALTPIGYVECDWASEASGGCPAAVPTLGTLFKYGRFLREPHGSVHWAGSEAGLEWAGGYMNGAVQSGVRAASDAINAIVGSRA